MSRRRPNRCNHSLVKLVQVEGLKIRQAEPEDCSVIQEIHACRRVVEGTLQLPHPSLEQWRRWLAEPGSGSYSLVAEVGGRVVGLLSLTTFPGRPRRRHAGSVGMAVHDDWQGKGVGSALLRAAVDMADNWLNLSRLELEVFTDNEPAIRLYQRFGFQREGLLRQYAFRNGQFVDAFAMARLRPSPPR